MQLLSRTIFLINSLLLQITKFLVPSKNKFLFNMFSNEQNSKFKYIKFSQYENIPYNFFFVELFWKNLVKFKEVNEEQFLKVFPKSVAEDVSKLDKSNEVRDIHSRNVPPKSA